MTLFQENFTINIHIKKKKKKRYTAITKEFHTYKLLINVLSKLIQFKFHV